MFASKSISGTAFSFCIHAKCRRFNLWLPGPRLESKGDVSKIGCHFWPHKHTYISKSWVSAIDFPILLPPALETHTFTQSLCQVNFFSRALWALIPSSTYLFVLLDIPNWFQCIITPLVQLFTPLGFTFLPAKSRSFDSNTSRYSVEFSLVSDRLNAYGGNDELRCGALRF